MHLAVADGRARDGEAVQERLAPLVGIALEPATRGAAAEVPREEFTRGLGRVVGHAHQQVVLIAVAPLAHARGQVAGQQVGQRLNHAVGDAAQPETLEEAVHAALEGEGGRHPGRAEAVDQQEGVLAVFLADVVGRAVDVLAGNRQARQRGQQLAAHGREVVGRIAAYIEDGAGLLGEGVQPHGEQAQLAGRARGLEQARGVGVEARGRVLVHGAHGIGIARVGGGALRIVGDVGLGVVAVLQPREDFLGRAAQGDAQVVDEFQRAVAADARVQRQFGIGRAAPHQGAARVVADAAQHRGADARRADHRMRLAPQRRQRLLQPVQRGAGQADHLGAAANDLHAGDAQGVDEHDLAVVVRAVGRGAARQARVGGLHDDDTPGRHGGLHHLPLLQQRRGPHHGQHRALARAVALAEAARGLVVGEHMGRAHGLAQLLQQGFAGHLGHGGDGRRAHASRTSRSPVMSATLLTLVSVMATRISFSSSSSRCLTPASPAAASA
ncbi:MAG: hypothetical protein GAK34_01791 [Delftia tsuruhatensis]|nr:MAG: hypothetical protein GAK34_01791 [Delftia tsuruhatensis]